MAPRHELPTHLAVEECVLAGLSMRPVLLLLFAACGAYALWLQLTWLPAGPRASLVALNLLWGVVFALWRPAGRPLEAWALIVLRFLLTPRVATWRPVAASGNVPPPEPELGDPLAERVAALVQSVGLLTATPETPLGPEERGVLDAALFDTYAAAGISRDPVTHGRTPPLLRDLQVALARRPEPAAAGLAARLRPSTEGALAGLFAGQTDVHLNRPLVVCSLRDLEPELRPLAIHLVAGHVWARARRDPRERLLVVDEAWTLLRFAEGAAFLDALARRARKHWLGLVSITQDVADALGHPAGRAVLTNANCKLLLQQDSATIGPLAEALHLSALELRHLLGAPRGEGLFCWRDARLPLRILASDRERALATTAPREVFGGRVADQEGDQA